MYRHLHVLGSVLGHEAVAEMVENRRPGLDLQPGDRFTFSVIDSCDDCSKCRHGLPQKCDKLKKVIQCMEHYIYVTGNLCSQAFRVIPEIFRHFKP